ncbi:MAG: hypothetical protein H6R07_156 [Proteobacteria bacterium]|nr:hypothetical protein [Pseudomonadota bacterium]
MSWRDWPWQDASVIQRSLAWLLASLLTVTCGLLFIHGMLQDARAQLRPLQTRLGAFRAAADSARTAWLDLRTNQQRYRTLEQRGMMGGKEYRLEWAEKLDALQRTEPALHLHYRIEPQRLLENSKPAGGSALFSSRMTVKYAAMHEEDFSRVHHELGNLPGWLAPARCVINRPLESGAALAVECDYEWISIAPNAGTKGKEGPER